MSPSSFLSCSEISLDWPASADLMARITSSLGCAFPLARALVRMLMAFSWSPKDTVTLIAAELTAFCTCSHINTSSCKQYRKKSFMMRDKNRHIFYSQGFPNYASLPLVRTRSQSDVPEIHGENYAENMKRAGSGMHHISVIMCTGNNVLRKCSARSVPMQIYRVNLTANL